MHSSDRTLLQRLGFADPDKKDDRHDLGCQYIAQPEVAGRIAAMCRPAVDLGPRWEATYPREFGTVVGVEWLHTDAVLEYPLTKGSGQYRTHIGFIDVRLTGHFNRLDSVSTAENGPAVRTDRQRSQFEVTVEVKVQPVPVGDVIRQLRLYDEYSKAESWQKGPALVLATVYEIDRPSADALAAAGIKHVRLGEKFDAYVAARREAKPSGSEEI